MDERETITLKEYFETRIKGLEDNMFLRFTALDKALMLSAKMADDKYEHLNNLKEEVARDKGKFVVRDEVRRDFQVINEKINELKEYRNRIEGAKVEQRENQAQSNWSTGLTVVTILSSLSLVGMILHLLFK